jgi:cell filamentation protein
VHKLAHHFDQLNYLHPFREGNGRTQRIFWSQIAGQAGYDLDWKKVSGHDVDQASRDAMEKQDLEGLQQLFAAISTRHANGNSARTRTAAPRSTSATPMNQAADLKERFTRHPELRDVTLDPRGLGAAEEQTPDSEDDFRL